MNAGLSSILSGDIPVERAIYDTNVDGLALMSSGPLVDDSAELLDRPAFGELLARMKQQYDHVLIDSPPILAGSDAALIAAVADATVLVVHERKTDRKVLGQVTASFQAVGGHLIGAVLNCHKDAEQSRYAYHYRPTKGPIRGVKPSAARARIIPIETCPQKKRAVQTKVEANKAPLT